MPRPRRPPWRVWGWIAAALVLAVVAVLLWRGSAAAATWSTTSAPPDVPQVAPAGAISPRWAASTGTDRVDRHPVEEGRVVLVTGQGVRVLDAVTGAEAWRYVRTDARLCGSATVRDLVVAVFRTAGRCDEAVALSVTTGVRAWTRNVNFRPDVSLRGAGGILLATSPAGIVTLDPVGSNIRWRQAAAEGCRFVGSDVGVAGVVALQRCAGSAVPQLRLFDGYEGIPRWTRDADDGETTLVHVGRMVTVAGRGGVQFLAGTDGAPLGTVPAAAQAAVEVATVGSTAFVRTGAVLAAVDPSTGAVRWSVPALGLPSAGTDRKALPGRLPVLVPEAGAFVLRDAGTGAELGRVEAPGLAAGGVAALVGPAVIHSLPGRVVGYR